MNIYFACSITAGREFENNYREIVDALIADGHQIPTSHLAQSEAIEKEGKLSPRDVYSRDVDWVENCDVLIAEVSVPSHGVGYELGYALHAGKPVLCLYQKERKVSKMITGNSHSALQVEPYATLVDAIAKAKNFIKAL